MQTLASRAGSTASLCGGESFFSGGLELQSFIDGNPNNLHGLRCKTVPMKAPTRAVKLSIIFPRAVLSQQGGVATRDRSDLRVQSSVATDPAGRSFMSAEQKVYDVVAKQAAMVDEQGRKNLLQDVRPDLTPGSTAELLGEAYVRCGEVCAEYAKTFYLGTFSTHHSIFLS